MVAGADVAHFRTFGFVVLRQAFNPGPLSEELDRSLRDGYRSSFEADAGGAIAGRYVPMMCERTPVSLALLDRFAPVAADLLGRTILPVRAKGVLYFGAAGWHNDSGHDDLPSVGFAAYLEPLHAGNGALRVMPGSHGAEFGKAVSDCIGRCRPDLSPQEREAFVVSLPAYPVHTEPGDVIVFDEHLYHASAGGRDRRQWRVDYVMDPVGVEEEARIRAYYAGVYLPDWDGGYDVDLYPTYGFHWRASGRPWHHRLDQLGAYEAAAAEESYARSQRARSQRARMPGPE